MMTVDLSRFSSASFDRGAGVFKEALWLLVSKVLFQHFPFSASALKCAVLRAFGAQVGRGVVVKPDIKIAFPWKLRLGDHVWLGEECWLLNLAPITLESHVCVSQRAFVCTGSHNYKSPTFDLLTQPVVLQTGAWLGAGAWVGPGVTVGSHAVLAAGSVASKDLEPFGVYRGNPAAKVATRQIVAPTGGAPVGIRSTHAAL